MFRKIAATLFLSAAVGSLAFGVYAQDSEDQPEFASSVSVRLASVVEQQPVAAPDKVVIDSLNLSAAVEPVGVDVNQAFDVPGADLVGWYKYGSFPGKQGSTVLAAHVDYQGSPGVFFELSAIPAGATIEVHSDNKVATYQVFESQYHGKDGLPTDELFAKDGDEILTLITCGGNFDPATRSYDDNFVVRASRI